MISFRLGHRLLVKKTALRATTAGAPCQSFLPWKVKVWNCIWGLIGGFWVVTLSTWVRCCRPCHLLCEKCRHDLSLMRMGVFLMFQALLVLMEYRDVALSDLTSGTIELYFFYRAFCWFPIGWRGGELLSPLSCPLSKWGSSD